MTLGGERFVPNNDPGDPFYVEHIQRYRFTKKFVKSKMVLDLGCGTGFGASELIKLGAKEVYAVDINPQAIKFAKKNFYQGGIKFSVNNATKLPYENEAFDAVVSFEVIEHIKNYKKYLQESLRVLKKGGIFIFSTPNALGHRAGTSPYHFKEFTPGELKELFNSFNLKLKLYGQVFKNTRYLKSEKDYFKRYNILTCKNKVVKKFLNIFSPEFKSFIYRLFWNQSPKISPSEISIKAGNIRHAVTLIGLCKKPHTL